MVTSLKTKTKYRHLVAWCHFMGSFQSYCDYQIIRAKEDDAPLNSIFKKDERWHTFDEVTSQTTQVSIGERLHEMMS